MGCRSDYVAKMIYYGSFVNKINKPNFNLPSFVIQCTLQLSHTVCFRYKSMGVILCTGHKEISTEFGHYENNYFAILGKIGKTVVSLNLLHWFYYVVSLPNVNTPPSTK